jgi:hypothetical protein
MSRSWRSTNLLRSLVGTLSPRLAGPERGRRPNRPAKRSPSAAPALEVLESRLVPADFVWTGKTSALWSDPANWLVGSKVATRAPGTKAGEVDSVEFDGTKAIKEVKGKKEINNRITTVDQAYQLGSLRIDTDYTGGVLTLNKSLTITQSFIMEGRSTIGGPADLVIPSGFASWDAGTMRGTTGKDGAVLGKTVIAAGVDFRLGGTVQLDTRTLETSAGALLTPVRPAKKTTLNLSGQAVLAVKGGYFSLSEGTDLNLAGKAKVINSANFTVEKGSGDIVVGPEASVVNNGSFSMGGGRLLAADGQSPGKFTNTSTFFLRTEADTPIPLVFDNSGIFSLALAGGKPSSVRFLGGGSFSGEFRGVTGQFAKVIFAAPDGARAPTYTWLNGLTFAKYPNEVPAVGVATAVTIPAANAVSILKDTTLVLGKKGAVIGDGSLTIDGGELLVPGGHEASISGGVRLVLTGNGVIDGGGRLTISGTGGFFWESGTLQGTGRTDLATDTQIGKDPKNTLVLGRRVTILKGKTATIGNAGNIRLAAANFTVINAGTVDFKDDSGFTADNAAGLTREFYNSKSGLVKKSGGTGTSTFPKPFAFDNDGGKVRVESGTLKIVSARQALKPATTTLNGGKLNTDGLLQLEGGALENVGASALDGEVFGDVLNTGGEVDPGGAGSPGLLTIDGITGSYTQQGAGALAIDLAGPTPGLGYDQLVVTGPLSLGGHLAANALPGFTGDSFTIVRNLGPGPTPGYFDGLPEGATLTLGGRVFRITYHGGASGQDVVLSTVTSPTITTVIGSPDASVYGQPVSFTATVVATDPGAGVPTGSVQFRIDDVDFGAPVVLAGGSATSAAIATLSAGDHTVTALYSGDATFGPGGDSATQTVDPDSTLTTVSSDGPTVIFGQPATLTATVTPVAPGAGVPTGTVTFEAVSPDGTTTTTLGTGLLDSSGHAQLQTAVLAPASYTIFAVYQGDANDVGSTSASITLTVTPNALVTVSSSALPAVVGQPLVFTATVTPAVPGAGAPTGSVQFLVDGNDFGAPVPLAGGIAISPSIATLPTGPHTITALYGGDAGFASNTGSLTQQVNPADTTLALTSSSPVATFGDPVTFNATLYTVAPGSFAIPPTGTVTFYDTFNGTTTVLSVVEMGGMGSFPPLDVGTHIITAVYSGDGNFNGSTSDPITQIINPPGS